MEWMVIAGLVALALVAGGAVALRNRLAGLRHADWHRPFEVTQDADTPDGIRRTFGAWPEAFAQLDAIIQNAPGTELFAGSLRAGILSYVTRSGLSGRPMITTIQLSENRIDLLARAAQGRSDTRVNRRRVEGWLAELRAL